MTIRCVNSILMAIGKFALTCFNLSIRIWSFFSSTVLVLPFISPCCQFICVRVLESFIRGHLHLPFSILLVCERKAKTLYMHVTDAYIQIWGPVRNFTTLTVILFFVKEYVSISLIVHFALENLLIRSYVLLRYQKHKFWDSRCVKFWNWVLNFFSS